MPVRFPILLRMTLSTGKNMIDLVTNCTRMLHRSNPQIVASGCKLHCADVHLGEKEAHKFIKEVVRAGKVNITYLRRTEQEGHERHFSRRRCSTICCPPTSS